MKSEHLLLWVRKQKVKQMIKRSLKAFACSEVLFNGLFDLTTMVFTLTNSHTKEDCWWREVLLLYGSKHNHLLCLINGEEI